MTQAKNYLSLEEFLKLPEDDVACELVDGKAIPKMSPKGFHAALQGALLILVQNWCKEKGRIYPEWALVLQRHGKDWVPVPDLTYISFKHLSEDWMKDEPCPTPPELAIEIISPGQTFGDLAEKASDYLAAGVSRVWVVDSKARSTTIFFPDASPQTKRGTDLFTDSLLEGLELSPQQIFQQAGLPN